MALSVPTSYDLILELSEALCLSVSEVGELLDIHPRTLQRRRRADELEDAESLRAQMLSEVFSLARTVFGETKRARAWLFGELPELDFGRPVDQLGSIAGYERVKRLLGQIAFGVY